MLIILQEKVLIVSPNCPSCATVKEFLRRKGTLQNYKVVDVSTPEGLDFARRLGVAGVPECAVIEGEGQHKIVRVCTDDEWKGMLKKNE